MILPPLPSPEMVVPIVGIIATNNGRTCDVHRFGCGNDLVLARPVHGCGLLLCLRKTAPAEISAFLVLKDGSDGCKVGFKSQKQVVGAWGQLLDGAVVRVIEVYTPEHPNSYCCALFHTNHGYALAKIMDEDD